MVNIGELRIAKQFQNTSYKHKYNESCDNFVEVKKWLKNEKM